MKNIIEGIGHTPLYQIQDTNIFVKLEQFNSGGSIKDRAVLGMFEDAMKKGTIDKDTILIEATSGNTGISLAMIGAAFKIPVVIVMPSTMSVERRSRIQAYGAKLVLSEGSKGMQGAKDKMHELLHENSNYLSLAQFENPANPQKHYDATAKEICDELGSIDVFVACVGTGGSFSGIARYLKEINTQTLCIAGESANSALLSGKEAGPHKIQGISANFIPQNFDTSLCDCIMCVEDDEAIKTCIQFSKDTGILVGISSGANIALAKRLAKKYPDKKIVTIAPDGMDKYFSVLEFD